MDRNYIELHLVVDRYLAGDLSDKEIADFEERLVWDQDLIDEVTLAEQLRDGLRQAMGDSPFVSSGTGTGIVRRIADRLSTPALAAAASFVLGIGLASLFMRAPDAGFGANVDEVQTEIVPLIATRGGADTSDRQTIEIRDGAWIVLLVAVTGNHDSYRVSVHADAAATENVWRQDGLQPTYPDALAIGMPGAILPPGDYLLTVEGRSYAAGGGFEPVQAFRFRSIRQD